MYMLKLIFKEYSFKYLNKKGNLEEKKEIHD